MRYKKPTILVGGDHSSFKSFLRTKLQGPKRFPALQFIVLLVIVFQLTWLFRTLHPYKQPTLNKKEIWSGEDDEREEREEREVEEQDETTFIKNKAKYNEIEEGVFVRKGKFRGRSGSPKELDKPVTMEDFKAEILEDHFSRQNFLMKGQGEAFSEKLKEKKSQVIALQGLAQLRQQAYQEGQKEAVHSGKALYKEAMEKRHRPWKELLKQKLAKAGTIEETPAEKAEKEKARKSKDKWEKLLALDDRGKTEQEMEELQLLQEADGKRAQHEKDQKEGKVQQAKPTTPQAKWKALIAMEDKKSRAELKKLRKNMIEDDASSPDGADKQGETETASAEVAEERASTALQTKDAENADSDSENTDTENLEQEDSQQKKSDTGSVAEDPSEVGDASDDPSEMGSALEDPQDDI